MNIKPPPIDFRTVFRYDAEQGILIRLRTGKPAGVQYKTKRKPRGTPKPYGFVDYLGKSYAVHRVVWAVVYGSWPKTSLDHIDHNTRNNRIENLRLASVAENQRNLSKYKTNTTGETGITKSITGKYRVRIGHNNERKCLGSYDTLEEAVAVRDAVLKVLGFHPNHGKI